MNRVLFFCCFVFAILFCVFLHTVFRLDTYNARTQGACLKLCNSRFEKKKEYTGVWHAPASAEPLCWDLFTPPQAVSVDVSGRFSLKHPLMQEREEVFGLSVKKLKQAPYRYQLEGLVEVGQEEVLFLVYDSLRDCSVFLKGEVGFCEGGLVVESASFERGKAAIWVRDQALKSSVELVMCQKTLSPVCEVECLTSQGGMSVVFLDVHDRCMHAGALYECCKVDLQSKSVMLKKYECNEGESSEMTFVNVCVEEV